MELTDQHRITPSDDVLSRQLDGEAVLLDLASGTYFGLDAVGSELWALISQGATMAELCAKVLASFEVDEPTARRDIEALVNELAERGLVEVAAPVPAKS